MLHLLPRLLARREIGCVRRRGCDGELRVLGVVVRRRGGGRHGGGAGAGAARARRHVLPAGRAAAGNLAVHAQSESAAARQIATDL